MKLTNVLTEKTSSKYTCDNKKSTSDFSKIIESKDSVKVDNNQEKISSQPTVYDYQAMLSEHISYLKERLEKGETEEKFQIGGETMTIGEWNNLLDNFDSIQEEILLGMRERHESRNEEHEEKEILRKLFEERKQLEENFWSHR